MVKIKLRVFSHRNPKRTMRIKQVPHGHSNLGKGTRVEAQAGEQVGEGKKTWFNRSHEETQYKCWLWHYLGNPYFLSQMTLLSPIVAKPVQILSS